jgi:hypothetical protein
MGRAQGTRGGKTTSRAKPRAVDRTPSRVRVSARSLAEAKLVVKAEAAAGSAGTRRSTGKNPKKKLESPGFTPEAFPLIPVRTAVTPRPEQLNAPSISIENVDWEDGDEAPPSPLLGWPHAQRKLQLLLTELGAGSADGRFDLREGRYVWSDADGLVLVEARAQLLACFVRASSELVMAWADPVLRANSVARLDEYGDVLEVDEAQAREIVLAAADTSGAQLVHALEAPHLVHFVALRALRAATGPLPVTPGVPVGLVLRGLGDLHRAVSRREDPTDVLRARFVALAKSLQQHADETYRSSEWVGRLSRASRVLFQLAGRLVPPTFTAIAAGVPADEWLDRRIAIDIADGLKLLEDEWGAFA